MWLCGIFHGKWVDFYAQNKPISSSKNHNFYKISIKWITMHYYNFNWKEIIKLKYVDHRKFSAVQMPNKMLYTKIYWICAIVCQHAIQFHMISPCLSQNFIWKKCGEGLHLEHTWTWTSKHLKWLICIAFYSLEIHFIEWNLFLAEIITVLVQKKKMNIFEIIHWIFFWF